MGKGLSELSVSLKRMMVFMMKKGMTVPVLAFLALMVFFPIMQVNAHNPSSMNLSYDFGNQELTVQVYHSVADVNTHYIYQVVVEKDSVVVLTKDYTSQNTTSSMSAIYSIEAAHGDVLRVTAKCSVSGQITEEVTVVDPESTDTIPTNGGGMYLEMTVIIAIAILAIGIVAVAFTVLRRR